MEGGPSLRVLWEAWAERPLPTRLSRRGPCAACNGRTNCQEHDRASANKGSMSMDRRVLCERPCGDGRKTLNVIKLSAWLRRRCKILVEKMIKGISVP